MRSIRLLAVATTVVVLGSACGGDGPPTDGENAAPVAIFTAPTTCTATTACNFTSNSTDDNAVTTWTWDFDGAGTAPNGTTASASFTYAAPGTYPVTLTVGDAAGLTHSVTHDVIVAAAPVINTAPTASFTLPTGCTAGTPCGFASTSTDAEGPIAATDTDWNFGDTGTGEGTNVTHTYTAAGTYTVTLTVTDNQGLASTPATQQLVVTAPASQDCTTTGTTVACSLTMTQRVTVKIVMVSEACELSGNDLSVTAPRGQVVFQNLCNRTPGQEYIVTDAAGAPLVFEAGTPIALRLNQGTPGAGDPPTGDPGIEITGNYPNWTLNIDDGGAAGTPGEPDFNDAVLTVQATVAP